MAAGQEEPETDQMRTPRQGHADPPARAATPRLRDRLPEIEERLARLEATSLDDDGAADGEAVQGLEDEIADLRKRLNANLKRMRRVESTVDQRLADLEAAVEGLGSIRAELDELRGSHQADRELIAVLGERFRRPAEVEGNGDPLDLNRASFEEVRALGVSATQATRVISARDAVGAFASLDELDRLPGFSAEQLEALKASVRV
jgi:DNA uptake protein ComE-like DNA-binding protein